MKKQILLALILMLSLLFSAHAVENPYAGTESNVNNYFRDNNVMAGDDYLKLHFDPYTFRTYNYKGTAIFDTDKKTLTLTIESKKLIVELSSFVNNKQILADLDPEYRPTEIIINATNNATFSESGSQSPIILFSKGFPDDIVKLLGVTVIDTQEVHMYFGPSGLNTNEAKVILVKHYSPDVQTDDSTRTSGTPRLAAVTNNKAAMIIENSDIEVKSDSDIRLAVKTLLKDKLNQMKDNREVDVINTVEKGVLEFFTENLQGNVKLVVRFFTSFAYDSLRDRYYRATSEPKVLEVIPYKPADRWSDALPGNYDQDKDCKEENLCRVAYENLGDSQSTCFCTKVNSIYGYRNKENEMCNIPKNNIYTCGQDNVCLSGCTNDSDCSYNLTNGDYGFACCDGTKDCNPASNGTCGKMGFMVLPGYGDVSVNVDLIKNFAGASGGSVLLVMLGDTNLDDVAKGINEAYAKGMTPIVRLLGPSWERITPTAEQMASYVKQLKSKAGKLEYVQVWNEPNFIYSDSKNYYLDVAQNYADYIANFKKALGDSGIKIVSAGLSAGGAVATGSGKRISGYDYFSSLLNNAAFFNNIDYLGYHGYLSDQPPDTVIGECDTNIVIDEYKQYQKLCGEGFFGYRYYLNQIKKKYGKAPKVMITEFGYSEIMKNTNTKIGYLKTAIPMLEADPYVASVNIFVLNGLDTGWKDNTWISTEQKPLQHLVDLSNSACGGYGKATAEKKPVLNKEYEVTCSSGEFRFHPEITGVAVTDANYGSKNCIWESVVKELSCNEIDEDNLDEGKIYVRIFNEQKLPIDTEINARLGETEKTTTCLEHYPVCGDELETDITLKSGFSVFAYGTDEIQDLYMHNPDSEDYNFNSDKITIDLDKLPKSKCADTSKYESLYVRFIKRCK